MRILRKRTRYIPARVLGPKFLERRDAVKRSITGALELITILMIFAAGYLFLIGGCALSDACSAAQGVVH
tara:strand:- start:520 stop:729 length:210 start_codon:yes stop_codon:yes gene_type:complete